MMKNTAVMSGAAAGTIVVSFGWALFNRDAPKFYNYEGKTYIRGSITEIPANMANHSCSCREYQVVQ